MTEDCPKQTCESIRGPIECKPPSREDSLLHEINGYAQRITRANKILEFYRMFPEAKKFMVENEIYLY